MSAAELYLFLNSATLLVGWIFVLLFIAKRGGQTFYLITSTLLLGLFTVFCLFNLAQDVYPFFNTSLLFITLISLLGSDKIGFINSRRSTGSRYLLWIILFALFAVLLFLGDRRGWQSVMSTSVKYWVIFTLFFIWHSSFNKIARALSVLILGLSAVFWLSKITFLAFCILAISHLVSLRSLKAKVLSISFLGGAIVLALAGFSAAVHRFILDSVLRPDYDRDLKILGISDGSRINLWAEYLAGSVPFGRGEFTADDLAPTHNIFIYFAHEFGFIPAVLFAGIFLYCLAKTYKAMGLPFTLLLLASFNLSSVFEYATAWIFCIVFLPLASVLRSRRLTFTVRST